MRSPYRFNSLVPVVDLLSGNNCAFDLPFTKRFLAYIHSDKFSVLLHFINYELRDSHPCLDVHGCTAFPTYLMVSNFSPVPFGFSAIALLHDKPFNGHNSYHCLFELFIVSLKLLGI